MSSAGVCVCACRLLLAAGCGSSLVQLEQLESKARQSDATPLCEIAGNKTKDLGHKLVKRLT